MSDNLEDERTLDGHTILLIETEKESRTFSDYPDKFTCLNTIINMYEEERDASQQGESGDLNDFMEWLDSFYQIKLLIFDKEISRYRMTDREGLKKEFEENPENGTCRPTNITGGTPAGDVTNSTLASVSLNGITMNGLNSNDADVESDSSSNHEDWDE